MRPTIVISFLIIGGGLLGSSLSDAKNVIHNPTVRTCAKVCVEMTADTAAMSHFGQTTHLNNANVKISSTSGQLMKQFKAKEAYFSLSGSTFYFRGTSYKNKEGMINVETGALEFL